MAAKSAKGSKRNPLTLADMPFKVQRTANYWVELEGELAMTGRVVAGEVLSFEIKPSPRQRVVGTIA